MTKTINNTANGKSSFSDITSSPTKVINAKGSMIWQNKTNNPNQNQHQYLKNSLTVNMFKFLNEL